ncbi:MAG: glucosylglycerol-phosphate synthase [Betaproteobacteria bacterium]|jgi:glucosylglycerol-phosphate synthase|uniref:glucosylglycerol-phosphate synthase n=1 Tax=Thiomonas sp. TaxID=2047785 RepID=UPI000BC7DA74|nr:glucosylglycerol-phosphate synthase [Thiomonas sp.]MDE2130062.1 glucosylglycerol-phosphate synthase [Betaproteobacteria bacterium]OZB45092.1 MAG: glucosylglycerol-phosphate synthase [Thiomonas sp. 15-66-11]OZB64288.1 MAG: glucosylglycerol-phosphate synthase [Thiomonas sp. 13-66-29]
MASSLVIVYHRQPYEEDVENGKTVLRENASPNGIVPALKGFIGRVARASWIAWKKSPAGKPPKFERRIGITDSFGSYDVVRLPLSAEQVHQFYHVTSKEALWPILNAFPSLYSSANTDWATFREVNRLFAQAACEEAAPGAVVWVHDYNLWLVPRFVRELRPDVRIAFFHHTPFPPPDVFNVLPWRDEILDSLLACDLVGFHIPRYARNFAALAQSLRTVDDIVERDVPAELRGGRTALAEPRTPVCIRLRGHSVHIDATPIGTHAELIRATVQRPENLARAAQIRAELGADKLIVSVGRVDYAKGTREQLAAFERLLKRRPEWLGRVKLLLTAVAPAEGMTAYRATQTTIEQLVGRINGHFGTLSWQPIVFSTTSMPFTETLCHYRAADIAWITPLRDGLNLVAKEFVAAHVNDSGVLVLSEFAGAAVELADAVLVNPNSISQMDAAIDRALDMPIDEQRQRMQRLDAVVCQRDIGHWTRHMLAAFDALRRPQGGKAKAA